MTPDPQAQSPFLKFYTFSQFYLLALYGLWTALVWLGVISTWSFDDLRHHGRLLLWALPAMLPLAWAATHHALASAPLRAPDPQENAGGLLARIPNRTWVMVSAVPMGLSLALTAAHRDDSFTVQWLLISIAVLLLALPVFFQQVTMPAPRDHQLERRRWWENDLLMFLVCSGLLLAGYLLSSNTDADDTHFLGAVVSLLEYPEAPLFTQDVLFGERGLYNYIYVLNRGQSWEALVALLSVSWDVDHLDLYYGWLPMLVLVLVPAPLLLLLRRYHPRLAWPGVLFALLFIFSWSTFNHHAGHFFVPRMFQGKATFVTLVIPAIFLATRMLVSRPGPVTLFTLMLILIAGGGLTSSGLYLGLAAAGTAWLGLTRWNVRALLLGGSLLLLASLPNLAMLFDVYYHLENAQAPQTVQAVPAKPKSSDTGKPAQPPATAGVPLDKPARKRQAMAPPHETKNASIYAQFGGGKMLSVVMLLIWLAFAYNLLNRHGHERRQVAALLLAITLLTFNRPFSEALAGLSGIGNVVWRLHWALPASLVFGLAMSGAIAYASRLRDSARSGFQFPAAATAGFPLLILLLVFGVNAAHLAGKYSFEPRWYKVYPNQQLALDYFRHRDLAGRLVLADTRVAQLLPRFDHDARLISVGTLYWLKPYFDHKERWERFKLSRIINSLNPLNRIQQRRLRKAVAERGINLVIFDARRPVAKGLEPLLRDMSFECSDLEPWKICETP